LKFSAKYCDSRILKTEESVLNVAIIGSGVSGLSCAYRLNQFGVKPTVFEKRAIIGETVNLYGLHLNCFNLFSDNPLEFFEKKYNLRIKPMCPVNKINMISGNKKATVRGRKLGYIFKRGPGFDSLERQLFEKVDAFFYFDTFIMPSLIDDISKEFDAVVIATGGTVIPKYLGILEEDQVIQVKSGLIDGEFEPCQVFSWMKTEYSNNLFIYMLPITENRAIITLLADNTTPHELDYMWKKMLISEDIKNNILTTWEHEYHGGRLRTNQIGNLYFVGNAGGLTYDFLGFGIINSIASGIFAAEAIVGGTDYPESIKKILKNLDQIHNFRLLAERTGNNVWKHMTLIMGMPLIRDIIYRKSVKFHHLGGLIGNFLSR